MALPMTDTPTLSSRLKEAQGADREWTVEKEFIGLDGVMYRRVLATTQKE